MISGEENSRIYPAGWWRCGSQSFIFFFKMVELQIDYGASSSHQFYTLKSVICWISKNLNNEFLFFHRDLDIRESMVMESLSKGFLLI